MSAGELFEVQGMEERREGTARAWKDRKGRWDIWREEPPMCRTAFRTVLRWE